MGTLAATGVVLPAALLLHFAWGSPPLELVAVLVVASYAFVFLRLLAVVRSQRVAEDDLRRSRELYSTLAAGDPDCVKLVDRDGTIVMMNRAGLRICGGSAEQIVGKRWPDLVDPADAGPVTALIERVFAGHTETLEFSLVALDGTRRRLETHTAPLRDASGTVTQLVSATRDITGQRELESGYRALFEHSLDAMLIADDERVYLDANPAACSLLGLDHGAIVGRTIEDVFGLDAEVVAHGWVEFLAVGEQRGSWPVRRSDGTERLCDYAAKANVLPGRHLSILRDVTDQRRLEEQLQQSQKMEAVGRLAGGIAHDFNNLLQAISGYGRLALGKAGGDDGLRDDLEQLLYASERAADLTRQLLAFGRVSRQLPEPVDANEVVQETESLIRRLIGEEIEVVSSLARSLPTTSADRTQLSQVLVNLAVNARDAMPAGGTLTLSTADVELGPSAARRVGVPQGRYVMLGVSDTGVGMDEPTRLRAFDPFFTTKEVGKGTGLGLAMVYGAVAQSGGGVVLESAPGRGSTISVYLPAVAAVEAARPGLAGGDVAGGLETILLVEDEEIVRRLLATMLTSSGYRVVEAPGPIEALRLADEIEPDLLLTDIVMPKLNGHELAERLRATRPELRVLFASGYPDQALADRGVVRSDVIVLQKPFDHSQLAAAVRATLDGPVPA